MEEESKSRLPAASIIIQIYFPCYSYEACQVVGNLTRSRMQMSLPALFVFSDLSFPSHRRSPFTPLPPPSSTPFGREREENVLSHISRL